MTEHDADNTLLPLDSDIEVTETPEGAPRPLHLRGRYIAIVFAGGTLGTACRQLLTEAIPDWERLPVGTALINIVGAFVLGLLLEALARRGGASGIRRIVRLALGTGFLGGFTTYSALAVGTDTLARAGSPWSAVLYAAVTIIIGAFASASGIIVAANRQRRQSDARNRMSVRGTR